MTFPVAQPDTVPATVSTWWATHLAAVRLCAAALLLPIGRPAGKQASGAGRSSAAGEGLAQSQVMHPPRTFPREVADARG